MSELTENTTERPDWIPVMQNVKYAYANKVAMFMNNWDVRLAFGDENPANKLEPLFGIILSYQQAKALSQMLSLNIKRLEEEVGEIPEVGRTTINKKVGDRPEEGVN